MGGMLEIIPWKPDMTPEAGKCYSGMSNETYHGLKKWHGSSDLKRALRSVESFWYEKEQPSKNTIALERGGAFHIGMEGLTDDKTLDLFDKSVFTCSTKTILTQDWRDEKENHPDCYVLPEKERGECRGMIQNVYRKGSELNFFEEGWSELSFFWIDPQTGLLLKCRPDWFRPDGDGWILEYKTSKNHQQDLFEKDIAILNYHFSAAQYIDGVFQVTGVNVKHFAFLVSANTPPFEVECYNLNEPSLAEGRALFHKTMEDISGYRPDEPLIIKKAEIPPWAFRLTEKPWKL